MNPDDENNQTINHFKLLPVEVGELIADYLTPKETKMLALSSKATFFVVQDPLVKLKVKHLLTCVAYGQQDEAEKLLTTCQMNTNYELTQASLQLNSAPFTDYSGRTFDCTAYEYAYWAKDTHMCRMLEKHMDADTKAAMLAKCEKMEREGLKYMQDGQEFNSRHFDFTKLKDALKAYVGGYDGWFAANNWPAMDAAWLKVGLEQRDVPAHVVHEYCNPNRPFYPMPSFDRPPSSRILTFYNWGTGSLESWFPLGAGENSGLGFDFTLYRGSERGRPLVCWKGWLQGAALDLAAVSRLDKVRSADLTQLREALMPVELEQNLGMSS